MATPSSATTQSAQDIVLGALRKINAYTSGQILDPDLGADSLQTLNDTMDSLSNDNLLCYAAIENILYFTANQSIYTVGNPVAPITAAGTFALNSNVITSVSGLTAAIAAGLLAGTSGSAGSGVSQVASTLSDVGNFFPAGTYVTAINSVSGTITMSAPATQNGIENFNFTAPGNFGIPRPNNPTQAFTRINNAGGGNGLNQSLDYWIDIKSQAEWTQIGYKGVPGPWPTALYIDAQYPYANYYFYPVPNQSGELHLWTDVLLESFPLLTTKFVLPPGYARFLKLALALEIWPEFNKNQKVPEWLSKQYTQARALLEAKNQKKQGVASYDRNLPRSRQNDAGWIYDGGFNR